MLVKLFSSLFSQPPGQRHRRHNMCLFAPHSTIFVCRASREILWEIIFNFRGFSSRHLYSALTSLTIFPRLDETNADFSLQGVKNTFATTSEMEMIKALTSTWKIQSHFTNRFIVERSLACLIFSKPQCWSEQSEINTSCMFDYRNRTYYRLK